MAEEYKRKWHEHHDPKADKKQYIGTKILDEIEKGAIEWYQDERTLEGWEWLNPASVATAGAIRTVEGVGTVLAHTPFVSQGLQAIGKVEDVAAGTAGSITGSLNLDPRFGGWATRLASAWYGGKAITAASKTRTAQNLSKAAVKFGKIQADEIGMKAHTLLKKKHGKTYTRYKDDPLYPTVDVTDAKEIARRNDVQMNLERHIDYPQSLSDITTTNLDITTPNLENLEDLFQITKAIQSNQPIKSGVFDGKQIIGSTLEETYQPGLIQHYSDYRKKATTIPGVEGKAGSAQYKKASIDPDYVGSRPWLMKEFTPGWKPKMGRKVEEGYRIHHESPLEPSAQLKEGLTEYAKREADKYILKQGVPQGDLVEAVSAVPHDLHMEVLHKQLKKELGTGSLKKGQKSLHKIKDKYYPDKELYELELWERKPIFDEYIKSIQKARETTYDFYRALAAFRDNTPTLSNLDIDVILEAAYKSSDIKLKTGTVDDLIEAMIGPNKRLDLVKNFKQQFSKDFQESIETQIKKDSPLPRLIEDFVQNDALGWNKLAAAVGIDFTSTGELIRRPPQTTRQLQKNFKNFNVNQMELLLDEVTPKVQENLMLRMRLSRGKSFGKQPKSPSEFGQDN